MVQLGWTRLPYPWHWCEVSFWPCRLELGWERSVLVGQGRKVPTEPPIYRDMSHPRAMLEALGRRNRRSWQRTDGWIDIYTTPSEVHS